MSIWLCTTLAIVANGCVGLLGALLPSRWILGQSSPFVGFAAGAMLAAVFVDLLPESLGLIGTRGLAWAHASIAAMALLDWGVRRRARGEATPRVVPAALLTADALHNVADGAAIAAGFLVSMRAGVIATSAVIVHEVPEEVGDFAILRRAGMSRKLALTWISAVQMTAAIGAAATLAAAAAYPGAAGAALGVAAGTFLYIALAGLLPELLERQPDERSRSIGIAGCLVGIGVVVAQSFP